MAKYITSTDQNVALNGTFPFDIVSIPCNKGCVVPITTGVLTLRGGRSNNPMGRNQYSYAGDFQSALQEAVNAAPDERIREKLQRIMDEI